MKDALSGSMFVWQSVVLGSIASNSRTGVVCVYLETPM